MPKKTKQDAASGQMVGGVNLAEVERLQREEVSAGVPMAKWAMAWCLRDPIVTTLIPGCKNPEQVRANASAADFVEQTS